MTSENLRWHGIAAHTPHPTLRKARLRLANSKQPSPPIWGRGKGERVSRLAVVLVALIVALTPTHAAAANVCGGDLHLTSPQDTALLAFARRADLADPDAFREVADYLHAYGTLPPCYLTKRAAENDGWRPGDDLWRFAVGDAIGGDRYSDREHRLPGQWRGRYVEADLDYAGGHRGAHRLIFVRRMGGDWLIFVSIDHYRHFVRFMPTN